MPTLHCSRWLRLVLGAVLALGSLSAQALPSYARQTGQECAACHVGAFGPQLTPYGQKFKIGGYTDGKFADWGIPVSTHLIAGYTHTKADQPDVNDEFKSFSDNDNSAIQEVSAFLAGKLGEHVGTFSQVTYSGIEQRVGWDNVDVRYARELKLGGQDAVLGVSLNNAPTVQDPFNTFGVWSFPYTASDLGHGPASTALLSGENQLYGLGQNVLGLTGYAFLADSLYLEVGGYRKLPGATLSRLGAGRDSELPLSGITPYWRLAYTGDFRHQNYSIGLIGLNAKLKPEDGGGSSDRFKDLGIDATYQFLGTRKHIGTINAAFLQEKQTLDYSLAAGAVDQRKQTQYNLNLNAAYYYRNTYGISLGGFNTHGTADSTLYADNRLTRPDTAGTVLQLDWTPTGKESFQGPAWLNYRLALQYTAFSKYNGSTSDYDGSGGKASDNNTLFLYLWSAL